MDKLKIEQIALSKMVNSQYVNEKQEDFVGSITDEDELNFDAELAEYERLDCEAKTEAQSFYVRWCEIKLKDKIVKFKIEPTDKDWALNYFVYYKRGFFSRWKKLGNRIGYMKLDECIKVIEDFKQANQKIKTINEELEDEI